MGEVSGVVAPFALALYDIDDVSPACLARAQVLTVAHLNSARARVDEWHREVVRPLRSVRQRLKTGPRPAPTPATMGLRRELQRLEIEAELVELAELDAVAAAHDGPRATGDAAARATAAMTVVVLESSDRGLGALDGEILEAVAVIAAAAAGLPNEHVGG